MCGRFTRHHAAEEIGERFEVDPLEEAGEARYNIAPSQLVPVVHQRERREMMICRWGLVPFWAKDPAIGNKMINAKAETLAEKPSFKRALAKRRCLVPADGFYEWPKKGPSAGQPIYVRRRDGGLFAFAGLWEEWKSPEGLVWRTFTIITIPPNELVSQYHHRMAAMLRPEDEARWIDPTASPSDVLPMLKPYPSDELEAYPVSRDVNSPRNDDSSLILPVAEIHRHSP